MLKINSLTVSAPLFPNLVGDFQIDEIISENISILISENDKGISNWNFANGADSKVKEVPEESGRLVIPSLKKLVLEDISVDLDLKGNERKFYFHNITAENINFEDKGTLSSSMKIDDVPINLEGGLSSLSEFINGSPLNFNVDIEQNQNKLFAKGELHHDAKSYVELKASGENLGSLAELLQTELPPYGKYKVSARVSKTHDGGAESVTINNLLVQLDEQEVTGNAKLLLRSNGDIRADVDLSSQSNRISAKGTYKPSGKADFDIAASGKQLSELSSLVLNELPSWEDYEVSGSLHSQADKKIQVEGLKLRIGQNDLEGEISAVTSPLSITADLRSNSFDLAVLAPKTEPQSELQSDVETKNAETKKEENSEEEVRIPYDAFDSLDLDITLTVKNLVPSRGIKLADTNIKARVNEGVVDVSTFSGKLFGGSFTSNLKLAKKGISVKLDASKFSTKKLLLSSGETPFLTGDFNIAADLNAKGEILDSILKSLSGTMKISSENAAFENSGLHTVSSGLADILAPLFRVSKEADSECIIFNYDIENGIARSDTQVLKLKKVFIFAEGEIDIPKNKLEYDFSVQSTSPALASLIPPFRAFGKLDSPYFVPSISGTVASVADSGEAAVGAVTGIAKGAKALILGDKTEKLSGLAVCQRAYEIEQKLLSSHVGNLIKGKRKSTNPTETNDSKGIETVGPDTQGAGDILDDKPQELE
jgi:uncharacterized protein involved in outer membrane biogenesis